MKYFSIYIIVLIFLFSCNNNSINLNHDKLLSADLSGDINFKFNSSKVNYILFETGEVEIYSEQLINPNEILTINIKFLYQNGLTKFNLSNLQNRTFFEIRNFINTIKKYDENVAGEIEVISLTKNSIEANFKFSAEKKDTKSNHTYKINISNGKIIFKN